MRTDHKILRLILWHINYILTQIYTHYYFKKWMGSPPVPQQTTLWSHRE